MTAVPREPERIRQLITEKCGGVIPPDEVCWLWPHTKDDGYGVANVDGQRWRAHRLVWHHLVAPLPKSVVVHHRCGNRACVNPSHLQATSAHANTAEMLARRTLKATIAALEAEVHDLLEEVLRLTDENEHLLALLEEVRHACE